MNESSGLPALPVNRCGHDHVDGDDCPDSPYFTLGQAVLIAAPPIDAEGRDPASTQARRYHNRIGIVVYVKRCERETVPRVLYSIALWPAIQVRLYACELQRYDGERQIAVTP